MDDKIKCMFPRRVDADLVAALPIVKCPCEIALVDSDAALDAALGEIRRETLLGFDTETRPSFSKTQHYKVSILQLAGENKAWVIRLIPLLHRLDDIYAILADKSIKKAGLAVNGDIRSLSQRQKFQPAGFIDVSHFSTKMGIINTGMKNLAALFLGERVSKASQMSNWEAPELTRKQIDYAATDAWMSRRLYLEVKKVVDEKKFDVEPEPEPEPQKLSFADRLKSFFSKAKTLCNKLRRAIKKAIKPKPPRKRRRKRRRGRGRSGGGA